MKPVRVRPAAGNVLPQRTSAAVAAEMWGLNLAYLICKAYFAGVYTGKDLYICK